MTNKESIGGLPLRTTTGRSVDTADESRAPFTGRSYRSCSLIKPVYIHGDNGPWRALRSGEMTAGTMQTKCLVQLDELDEADGSMEGEQPVIGSQSENNPGGFSARLREDSFIRGLSGHRNNPF